VKIGSRWKYGNTDSEFNTTVVIEGNIDTDKTTTGVI
jgi:hypothetical protein